MHDHVSWSLGFGRWGRVHVHVHMFFFLFAALTCYLSWWENKASGTPHVDRLAIYALLVLSGSVALHELGHLWAARQLGGRLDALVLVPWGGLVRARQIRDPRAELLVHLAGPAMQLAVCLLAAPMLIGASATLLDLLNPLAPEQLTVGTTAVVLAKLIFWINWTLLLVNLLPVFPFDGGAALRAALLILSPTLGRQHASWIVATLAKILVIGLACAAFVMPFDDSAGLVPAPFALVLLCIFLFFSAQHEDERAALDAAARQRWPIDDDLAAELALLDLKDDESDEDTDSFADAFGRQPQRHGELQRRQELLGVHQHDQEAEEERRLDEILQRLHQHGSKSLSAEDRATLERISVRYRSRLSH